MGTYQSSDIYVTVPADKVAGLAQELREKFLEATSGWYGDDTKNWTDAEVVGNFLPLTEGDESRVEFKDGHTVEEDGSVCISGGFYGKVSYDNDEVEAIYAKHGAVGIIDSLCEDVNMRVRLKDGKVGQYIGVVTYPEDPEAGA